MREKCKYNYKKGTNNMYFDKGKKCPIFKVLNRNDTHFGINIFFFQVNR